MSSALGEHGRPPFADGRDIIPIVLRLSILYLLSREVGPVSAKNKSDYPTENRHDDLPEPQSYRKCRNQECPE